MSQISDIIAKAQITNGGPVILLQPENEYSQAVKGTVFPDDEYMQMVEDQCRKNGIVVPLISNDARPQGLNAPGNGTFGNVDIYGHDAFECPIQAHTKATRMQTLTEHGSSIV